MSDHNTDQTPANADEGASPATDTQKQNPGETSTADLTGEDGDGED